MNLYFACSITGGREFEPVYQEIVAALMADGHEIPTSHLVQSEVMEKERILVPQDVYERDVNWIKNCDVLIAEVSVPSHGVGYEIGYALTIQKPVLCIHKKERRVSKMITGNPDQALTIQEYSTVEEAIAQTLTYLHNL
ncbi:nucleoside 2-deoxyribosyltransferase [Candidatus Villigracilis saccharophilus]|uniref:nucleoside 2-deoxyribosyltransferase n=1 Tax=Candidatus Villigracilis saccharophilus TaxID=3140684 RepID=UPI0031355AD1|nr:nucleoside 2-deoxyribosyltransferase [Anaerolineales bacterium]